MKEEIIRLKDEATKSEKQIRDMQLDGVDM